METLTQYKEHSSIMKGLSLHEDFAKARESYREGFENIYAQAIEEDVKLSNVKEFLADLTEEELATLQNYAQLADKIEINELSDEGAYNLLMHFYEKYDFDNDGFTEDGNTKTISLIPQDIDNDLKEAFVNALNNSQEDNTLSMLVLTLDINKLKHDLAQHINNLPTTQKDYLKENTSLDIDLFVESELENPYKQKQMTYDSMMLQFESILNPELDQLTSPTFRDNIQSFVEVLENEYRTIKESKVKEIENQVEINYLSKSYNAEEVLKSVDPLSALLQA